MTLLPSKRPHSRYLSGLLVGLFLVALAVFFLGLPQALFAAEPQRSATVPFVAAADPFLQTAAPPTGHAPADVSCRSCHADSQDTITFPSGESLSVGVDLAMVDGSVHGTMADPAVGCSGCHRPADYQFPHKGLEFPDLRSYEITRAGLCENCHTDVHLTAHPGAESENPVVCTDCHTSHDVQASGAWHSSAPPISNCVSCHTSAGVEIVDPSVLSQRVQSGLFVQQRVNNDFCLACHGPPGQTMTFENGDVVSISVDGQALHDSVHGSDNSWQELACVDCHKNYDYPHNPVTATSAREYSLQQVTVCAECHQTQHEGQLVSVHQKALDEGKLESAICSDCHGPHDAPVPNEPPSRVAQTCRECHSSIFDEYAQSVHGQALLNDENTDVPSCVNCHGVHDIGSPSTPRFRNQSPQLCGECHADEELMAKYDIRTEVFNNYVADFHGTTVTLFQSDDPLVETNKAVCYDCHGHHNIMDPNDPDSNIKLNLLTTCKQCHPDATDSFPDSWTGHHTPTLRDNPVLYLVNIFYAVVIPSTVAFLVFLVGTDVYRKIRGR